MRSPPSTCRYRRAPAPSWRAPREPVPTIVADLLVEVADPLRAALDPGPATPAPMALAAIAGSVAPAERAVAAPPWLRPDQVAPFRRVLAALDRHHGALLADPVGSGKTWIALAVATALAGPRGAVAIVPASLRSQWRATAARLGIPLTLHSHEALSRGRPPAGEAGLVIVDESHRFRNPAIRRYHVLADWLIGRRALLLSATPVVNRLEDLAHQLLLAIRDDSLAPRALPSLRRRLAEGRSHPALGDVVLCRAGPPDRPHACRAELALDSPPQTEAICHVLHRVRLSTDPGVAALIRCVLLRAFASSPAALAAALRRYLRLLDHAEAAAREGRRMNRAALRAFTGEAMDQLVMWALLPEPAEQSDLISADRPALSDLLACAAAAADPRADALDALLADDRLTVVFSASRDTLEALRRRLAHRAPAWVTGEAAGIGAVRMEREAVLSWFRPQDRPPGTLRGPRQLLATDVAAEGLDLQRAERIVHYDLPWTGVRMEQREGRAVRLGARAARVEIIRFAPWPAVESRLRQVERILAKRRLVTTAGLDEEGRWLYRWRADLSQTARDSPAAGYAVVRGREAGWLFALAFDVAGPGGAVIRQPADLLWADETGVVTEDPARVAARLLELERAPQEREPGPADREAFLRMAVPVVRRRLRQAAGIEWGSHEAPGEVRAMARRLRRLASEAARSRARARLSLVDQLLDWLAGGLTAGEAGRLARCQAAPDRDLLAALRPLLARPRIRWTCLPRLAGVVRVVPP